MNKSVEAIHEHGHHGGGGQANVSAHSLEVHLSHDGLLVCHAYFGTYFVLLGVWWALSVFRGPFPKGTSPTGSRRSSLTFAGKCGICNSRVLEGLIKFVTCLFGIIVEVACIQTLGRPYNYSYPTVYGGFLLAALTDIISGAGIVLPDGMDYATNAVAFANLGLIAHAQGTGHMHLTVATRLLTSYVALFNAGILLWEYGTPKSQILKCLRVGGVTMQGIWFWQSGIVLDSSWATKWVETDHANLMYITIAFAWDMCCVVILLSLIAIIIGCIFPHQQVLGIRRNLNVNLPGTPEGEPPEGYRPLEKDVTETAVVCNGKS
ncbi:unnamed protein product [Schistocephalus solidus]|uniref:Transmembrane protein 45B n=1 Tax=Schistocephalus solidus TaxID=70667 RepID=A0A183S817_SCHSO|nr:unnamed protein product [Schistocephalus solidus]